MQLTGVSLLVLLDFLPLIRAVPPRYWDYIVVGAGPSGLQLGYFLSKANRDYVILEKANISGSFFVTYPRHDKLISINKRHTGKTNKEFNLRHDWNSLISDDESLQIRHYSREFFPHRTVMLDYLRDYENKLGLHVMHNINVREIERVSNQSDAKHQFSMTDQDGNIYNCRTVIIATGMSKPHIPDMPGMQYAEGYEDVSVDPEDFEGQSVLILGRGNSAFEVADRIYGSTSHIHMISRDRARLSWSTHYVGDLRAINNGLLDTYQLKSLDAVLEGQLAPLKLSKNGDKLYVKFNENITRITGDEHLVDNFPLRGSYDRVIRCLGFSFDDSIFTKETKPLREVYWHGKSKFPLIKHNYESVNVPGLFYAGAASHSLDHRKSAGGFIHGYRYTARALHRLLEWRNHGIPWPSTVAPITQLLPTIVKRINEASGIYQMFSMLGDIVVFRRDKEEFEYYEEFPVHELHNFTAHTGVEVEDILVILLNYGADFSGPDKDTLRNNRATGASAQAYHSNFLHPVFYYYKSLPTWDVIKHVPEKAILAKPHRLHHTVEDFCTAWDAPRAHVLPLRRFLENILNEDLRHFMADKCFLAAMTNQRLPLQCQKHYLMESGIVGTDDFMSHVPSPGLVEELSMYLHG